MKAIVDKETCIGCGECIDVCPEVYRWDDDKAETYKDPVPEEHEDCAEEGADICPVDAIEIQS